MNNKTDKADTQERQVWRGGKAYPMAPGEQTPAEKAFRESIAAQCGFPTVADRFAYYANKAMKHQEKLEAERQHQAETGAIVLSSDDLDQFNEQDQ